MWIINSICLLHIEFNQWHLRDAASVTSIYFFHLSGYMYIYIYTLIVLRTGSSIAIHKTMSDYYPLIICIIISVSSITKVVTLFSFSDIYIYIYISYQNYKVVIPIPYRNMTLLFLSFSPMSGSKALDVFWNLSLGDILHSAYRLCVCVFYSFERQRKLE